ncbi:MAG: ATP-binding protein [Oligoflexia bacterium]|nr:ATP-binding protein [Oligoflexia bacterium]
MNPQGDKLNILLVEGDERVRQECLALFSQAGWSCEVATPEHVMNLRNATRHDIIVTDLEMPNLRSLELLKMMRSQKPAEAIVVTPNIDDLRQITEFLREGAADVVPKPMRAEHLKRAIERIIGTLTQRSFENNLYRFLSDGCLSFCFRSKDLAGNKIPLYLLDQLYLSGRIDLTSRLRLELAFQESLANALEHGNLELLSSWREIYDLEGNDKFSIVRRERLQDPIYSNRLINVQFDVDGDWLTIKIRDQGKGYLPQSAHKLGVSEESLKCSGRGTAIIHGAVDEVSYNAQGNEIRLRKRIGPSAPNGSR